MNNQLIIILVGLPARGKSYTSNHLSRFLNWYGLNTKVFNCGEYRRKILGGFQDAEFFNFNNKDNFEKKEEISKNCYSDLIKWLDDGGQVAIFDATNSNVDRRNYLCNNSGKYSDKILFIELISENKNIIENNLKLKLISPDYVDKSETSAMDDFKKRLDFYNKCYQTIEDSENLRYIKIINFTEKLIINNVIGINETLVMSYLMNLRLNKHPIYISRHGESQNNIKSIIGGDPNLTEKGEDYAIKLHKYIKEEIKDDFIIFTSCLKRTIATARHFKEKKIESRLLNEIHGGICEGMTYEEIKENHPDIHLARKKDKLRFRYPEGESYLDLLERLRDFVMKLSSYNKPILIVAHNAIVRVLLSYFKEIPHQDIPHTDVNLHTVNKLIPNSKNYTLEQIKLL